jgi:MHS family proline/betaine transporter-like MFS transporter
MDTLIGAQKSLTREQKQAVGILSIGTVLEYFDLMLYVHMAVLLNDLFFSKADEFSAQLLGAFSFCLTFVFRPIGALLIGRLGDRIGRKATVIITTTAMSISCIVMANLPTYEQVGVIASWAVTICRILQGMSSMGERIGAEVYLTELIPPPFVYPAVAFVSGCLTLGTTLALFVANISLSQLFNWRAAFWVGAIVAVIGLFARRCLRETPDFANAKRQITNLHKRLDVDSAKEQIFDKPWIKEKMNKKTAVSFFLMQLSCPVCFYLIYIHSSNLLKDKFGYTTEQIIHQNFIVSSIDLFFTMLITCLVYFVNPLKFLKIKFYFAAPFILAAPLLLDYVSTGSGLMIIQILLCLSLLVEFPATPIFYKSFPIFQRFTTSCFSYALSRALMYVISSFGIIYLIKYFGNLGLLFLLGPVVIGYGLGLFYFIRIEDKKETGFTNKASILVPKTADLDGNLA